AARQLLGGLLRRRGELDVARAQLHEAVDLRTASGDPEGRAAVFVDLVRLEVDLATRPDTPEPVRGLLEGLARAGDAAPGLLRRAAHLLLDEGRLDLAAPVLADLSARGPASAPREEAEQNGLASRIARAHGDLAAALDHATRAVAAADRSGLLEVRLDALEQLVALREAAGDLAEARRLWIDVLDGRILLRDADGRAHALDALAG